MKLALTRLFGLAPPAKTLMDYEEAKRLAADPDDRKRAKLARRADVQPEVLYFLAGDKAPEVRRAIAGNHATPVHADLVLARDADDDVRCVVAQKVARLAPGLSAEQRSRVGDIVVEVLRTLATDQLPRVRRILAEELKSATGVPTDVVERLARDDDILVAAPVLESSPLLSDEFLLEIIASRPVQGTLDAIARRAGLGERLSDAIVAADKEAAVTELLGNRSAQIREETLDEIVDRAERVAAWHKPLVSRPSLSARAVRRLTVYVADALLAVLARRDDLDPETAREVAAKVRNGIERELEPGPGSTESAADQARRLAAAGALDEPAILRALDKGRREFVVAAIAHKSGIHQAIVEKVFSLSTAKGIVALVWKAGLSPHLAEQLQTRLGRIAPADRLKAKAGAFPLSQSEMEWQLEFFGVPTS
jgi:uncharacterized protein (DUF2336 family)